MLSQLGIPMANAINLYFNQIILHNGIPFELKLPRQRPLDFSMLSQEQFDAELEKGLLDLDLGKTSSAKQVREKTQRHL